MIDDKTKEAVIEMVRSVQEPTNSSPELFYQGWSVEEVIQFGMWAIEHGIPALKFYSEESAIDNDTEPTNFHGAIINCGGKKAKEALAKLPKEKE